MFTLGIIFYSLKFSDQQNQGSHVILNILHLLISSILLKVNLDTYAFHFMAYTKWLVLILDCVYVSESFVSLLSTIINEQMSRLGIDWIFLTFFGLLVLLCWRHSRSKVFSLMHNPSAEFNKDIRESLMYIQTLYYSYQNQKEPEYGLYIMSALSHHLKICRDPVCLCFQLKLSFDKSLTSTMIQSS